MIEKRQSGNGENKNEFFQALGLKREEASKLRSFLDKRLIKLINEFPFLNEETPDLNILTLVYSRSNPKSEIILNGLEFPVTIDSIEKTMDNIIIARSKFCGNYQYGPKTRKVDRTNGHQAIRFIRKSIEFPVFIEGKRGYLVSKNIDYIEMPNENEGKKERRISLDYSLTLLNDGLMFNSINFDLD